MMSVRFWLMKNFYGSFHVARLLLLLAILTLNTKASAEATNLFKIQIAGLRVVAPAPGDNNNLRALNWSPGVTVAMLVTAPEGCLLGIDPMNSKLDAFTDDKGGDLLDGASRARINLESSPTHGKSNALLLEVITRSMPTKSATELSISGKVFVKAASQTKEFISDEHDFNIGAEFSLGDLKLTLSKIKPAATGCTLTLEADQDLTSLFSINFINEQGVKIDSAKSGISSSISTSGTKTQWSFTLNRKLEHGKISAVCWTDLKTVEVPIHLKTGVGL